MIRFTTPEELKVLVVDDDPFIRELLVSILESADYVIETAENGADAFQKFSQNGDRNLIISDIDMPEMNGLELIRKLREIDTDIPIIILTGNNEISIALEAINKGASDYLLKDEHIRDTIIPAAKRVIEKRLLEERVDSLLKNTLPETVVRELKYKGDFEPRQYYCTILFTDFVKFTQLAENMSREALVKTLDEIFIMFDELMDRFRGTKIKTIGDAYMAVFGAPDKYNDHAVMAIGAAVAMTKAVENFNRENNRKFRMRIGIHTGLVMAGVVGRDRMQFDVFGDDVNIASRFESSGEEGRINLSEETYLLAGKHFQFEERGFISLKNKPDMKAYFVRTDVEKILVAHGDAGIRKKLGVVLGSSGYVVETADNGMTALDCRRKNPDLTLIFSGMNLAGIDGPGLVRELRGKKDDIPVIVIPGKDDIKAALETLQDGADDYLVGDENIGDTAPSVVGRVLNSFRLKRENIRLTEGLARKNMELERLSFLDGMTGIANRRYFNNVMDQEWGRAVRNAKPISLIMADIDFFDLFNQTCGHEKGDECLKQVADALGCALRRSADFIARYGGEEFVAVLPDTDLKGAANVAQTMRENVAALKIPHTSANASGHVTVSLGVGSAVPAPDSRLSDLVSAVERALGDAKQKGRNQVAVGHDVLE